MSFIKTDDNVKLFYESTGKGEPIILFTNLLVITEVGNHKLIIF